MKKFKIKKRFFSKIFTDFYRICLKSVPVLGTDKQVGRKEGGRGKDGGGTDRLK